MAHTAPAPLLGDECDDFLVAPIGDDRNGMTLSVRSAPEPVRGLGKIRAAASFTGFITGQIPAQIAIRRDDGRSAEAPTS
jgi:hypothetical protein